MPRTSAPTEIPQLLTSLLVATRQTNFEQAVACALHLWPALTLSVQNGWGGPDSDDKRGWFAGEIASLFPDYQDTSIAAQSSKTAPSQEPDIQDIETILLQVMIDEFDVNVDDDSGMEVAGQIIRARIQCAAGVFDDEVRQLRERFDNRKGKKVDAHFKKMDDADQDTDWESGDSEEDDEEDVAMGQDMQMSDAPQQIKAPREKPEPEVDAEGFTTVLKKKR